MKSKPAIITVVFQMLVIFASAQAPFQKVIGGFGVNGCNATQITADNGFIIATDGGLIKTDSMGAVEWAKNYSAHLFHSVKQTYDGGYIVTGVFYSAANMQDFHVIRTNANGDTLWTRAYGGSLTDLPNTIEATPDTGYIIGGSTTSFGGGAYLIKINDLGDTLWTRTFANGNATSIKKTSDNNFIVAGDHTTAPYPPDIFLIKINQNGDTLWTKYYNAGIYETAREVIQTADGGYALIGATNSMPNQGQMDVYFLKTDPLGNFLWSKSYGSGYVDEGAGLRQTADGGYILGGRMQGYTGGGGYCGAIGPCYDFYLVRTDANGDTLWTKTYGGDNLDLSYSLDITNDGGYLITGQSESFNTSFPLDAYIIKTDANGNGYCNQYNTNTVVFDHVVQTYSGFQVGSGGNIYTAGLPVTHPIIILDSVLCMSTGITEINTIGNNYNMYPNPLHHTATLTFSNPEHKNHTLTIYDALGREERSIKNITENKILIERKNAANGLYFFILWSDNGIAASGKFLIE